MSTVTIPTRNMVSLLQDLLDFAGKDPDVPENRGILLHTSSGEYAMDRPGAPDGEVPLIETMETDLLVGTATDGYAVAQAHEPCEFGATGWLDPVFIDLLDAKVVARDFEERRKKFGRERTHYVELTSEAGKLTVREDPMLVPGGLRMAFRVDDGSAFPRAVLELMTQDPTMPVSGKDYEVIPPSYGTGYPPAYVEALARVAGRRGMPISLYRHHQYRPAVVEVGASWRGTLPVTKLDETAGQHLAPMVRVFPLPQRGRRLEAVSDE